MRGALGAGLAVLLQACAHTGPGPLPAGLAVDRDMRGAFRAALCTPDRLPADECAQVLRTYDGEVAAPRPPAASPARHRLVFVPGFLASCFAGIHSFEDVVTQAREAGFTADVLGVGGRNDVASNARLIAEQVSRMTATDPRRIILVGHSKGANEILQMLVDRPDIATRVDALLTVAGALQGSPLADDLRGLYDATLAIMPLSGCDRGEGDPVGDLTTFARSAWWKMHGAAIRTPIYSIVTLPGLSRLSLSLFWPYAQLSWYTPDNDSMLRVQDQVATSSRLLGVVNANHLSVAIPHPGLLYLLVFSPVPFPRPYVYMAAIDVIAAQSPMTPFRITQLTGDQVSLPLEWATAEGWDPGLHDTACFAAADPTGFHAGWIGDEPVATISVVKYGATFAFLGLYIVKPEFRGKGHGFALWNHALATARGRTTGLDGVVAQQENYRRSGFALAYRNVRYRGVRGADAPLDARVVPLSRFAFAAIAKYDRAFFPEARDAFLRCWIAQPGAKAMAVEKDGGIAGYGVIRPSGNGFKVGPLFADDASCAESLFHALSMRVPAGAAIFLDVPEPNAAATALAERHGMSPVFETARMYAGVAPKLPLSKLFGVTTFELG